MVTFVIPLPGVHCFRHKINTGPAEDATFRPTVGRKCAAIIIVCHAPRLQGETITGLSQHQRKFSNVANEHHLLCLFGGGLKRDRPGDGRNRWLTAGPTTSVKFVLNGSFAQCFHYFCFNLLPRCPSAWQPTPAEAPLNRCAKSVQTTGTNSLSLTVIASQDEAWECARMVLRWTRSARSMLCPISA